MTSRQSTRAAARERYRALTSLDIREAQGGIVDLAAQVAPAVASSGRRNAGALPPANATSRTPEGSPSGAPQLSLMQQVRALYENGAVPVAEIARLAEVAERTLYKYVERGGWRRRYRVTARHQAAAAAKRGRKAKAKPSVLLKGTGGRFISRADAAVPHAFGLKAFDPAGAARVAERAAYAAMLSDKAQADTARARTLDAKLRTMDILLGAWRELAAATAERAPPPARERRIWRGSAGGRVFVERVAAPQARSQPRSPRAADLAARLERAIARQLTVLMAEV